MCSREDTVTEGRQRDDETPLFHHTVRERPGPGRVPSKPRVVLQPGAILDGYRIARLLGAGGMGSVYLARDESLERDVAIKLVRNEGDLPLETLERFRAEARTMARLAHPHVVRIHALGEKNGIPYIVMEYVPGKDLGRLLVDNDGPFRVAQALAILDQICRGTSAMHAAGLVHGDLKPSNVLFGPGFRVVISDLGLSRRLGAAPAGWSTPTYSAPEVAMSGELREELASRIDVYSIGVMAYEFLTGTVPFASDAERLDAAISGRVPPPPSARRPELGTAFDAPILAAIAGDPELRTSSVDTLRRALADRAPAHAPVQRPLRILVADDDPAYVDLVRRTLAKNFRGSLIETVPDGAAALAAALHQRPDLVVTDLDMPLMNGVELVAEIRARPALADVPVIVLSAIGGPSDWSLLDRLGANAFLGKPFDAQQLISLAHAVAG